MKDTNKNIAESVLKHLDGATIDLSGNVKNDLKGFMVSITDNRFDASVLKDFKVLVNTVASLKAEAEKIRDSFIGTWYDKDSDKVCLDISLNVKDKEQALRLAEMFNQQSVFDCENGTVLEVVEDEQV